ncbi:MAG: hypothetical protein ABIO95_03395 [Bdellovibrionota bacterium]
MRNSALLFCIFWLVGSVECRSEALDIPASIGQLLYSYGQSPLNSRRNEETLKPTEMSLCCLLAGTQVRVESRSGQEIRILRVLAFEPLKIIDLVPGEYNLYFSNPSYVNIGKLERVKTGKFIRITEPEHEK